MSDRRFRASAAGPVLSGVGTSLLVAGLLLLAVFSLWPGAVSTAISAQAFSLPVAPVALFLVGAAILVLSIWGELGPARWSARIPLVLVIASAALAFVHTGIAAIDQVGAAWKLVGETPKQLPLDGLSQFALWLGAAGVALFCASFVTRWVTIIAQLVGIFVCVCLAALVASAMLQYQGAQDSSMTGLVPSVSLGLCAYLAAYAAVISTFGRGTMTRIEPGSSSAVSLAVGIGFLPFVPVAGAALVYARVLYFPDLALPSQALMGVVGVAAFVLWALFSARLTAIAESKASGAKHEAHEAHRANDALRADLANASGDLALIEAKDAALEKHVESTRKQLVAAQAELQAERAARASDQEAARTELDAERAARASDQEEASAEIEAERAARASDQESAHARAKETSEAHSEELSRAREQFDVEKRSLNDRIEVLESDLQAARSELSLVTEQHEREQALYESRLAEAMDEYDALLSKRAQEKELREAQLEDARSILVDTLRSIEAPIAVLNENGSLAFANDSFLQLTTGVDRASLAEFFTGEERDHVENALARALVSKHKTSDSVGALSFEIEPVRSLGWIVRLRRVKEPATVEDRKTSVLAIVGDLDAQSLDEHAAEKGGLDLTIIGVGGVGLELALRQRPDFVLVGTHLPDGSATDIVQAMRSDPRLSGVAIAVVSSSGQGEEEARARRSGADRIVAGPIDSKALIELVSGKK